MHKIHGFQRLVQSIPSPISRPIYHRITMNQSVSTIFKQKSLIQWNRMNNSINTINRLAKKISSPYKKDQIEESSPISSNILRVLYQLNHKRKIVTSILSKMPKSENHTTCDPKRNNLNKYNSFLLNINVRKIKVRTRISLRKNVLFRLTGKLLVLSFRTCKVLIILLIRVLQQIVFTNFLKVLSFNFRELKHFFFMIFHLKIKIGLLLSSLAVANSNCLRSAVTVFATGILSSKGCRSRSILNSKNVVNNLCYSFSSISYLSFLEFVFFRIFKDAV